MADYRNPLCYNKTKSTTENIEQDFSRQLEIVAREQSRDILLLFSSMLNLFRPMYSAAKMKLGHVANPQPVARIKAGRVSQPITDAADATGRDRSWNATCPWSDTSSE